MKKITFFLIAIVGIGLLFSCEEKENLVLDMSLATAPSITNPADATSVVLLEENADSMVVFEWASANYNLTNLEATKYAVQVDLVGNDFAAAKELINIDTNYYAVSVSELNSFLKGLGLEVDVPTNVEMRLFSYVNTSSDYTDQYSGFVTYEFTTYETAVAGYPSLWVPGDYQGWAPADAPKIYDFDGDGVYNGYIYFPEGGTFEFKFTSDPDWDHTNYGFASDGVLDTDAGAGNLTVPGAGGYKIEVDVNNLTWTATLENWGVIGEWLSWASDVDLVWDIETQDLSVTVDAIPAASDQRFKFRANDDWAINLGANDPDDGTLFQDGADIPIPDGGTITFILRFTTPEPSYELQ
jgi:starch-binding outer membrane protein SusE/F